MNEFISEAKKYLGADKTTHNELIDYYNEHCVGMVAKNRRYRMRYNDEWCAMFTSVVAAKLNKSPEEFPFEVSVYYQTQWAIENGKFSYGAGECDIGDLLIFDWEHDGGFDHVGFISYVTATHITTLEGNKGGTVDYRTFKRGSRSVKGVVRLTDTAAIEANDDLYDLARRTMLGEFGNGVERELALGVHAGAVQKLVNELMSE